jgi:hypothetical protein
MHVSKRSVDSTLRCNCVTSCREEFRDTSRTESSFSQAKSSSQTSAASADDNRVIFMVNDGVFMGDMTGGFLCIKRLTGKYPGCWSSEGKQTSLIS